MRKLIRGVDAGWIGVLDGEFVSKGLPKHSWWWLFTNFLNSKDL